MLYRNIFYLFLIIFSEIFIFFSLTYGYFHTENHYILRADDLKQFHLFLMKFNIITLISHIFIATISLSYLKRSRNFIYLIIIAVINLIVAVRFFIINFYNSHINIKETSLIFILREDISYIDVYYILPMLWATIYLSLVFVRIKHRRNVNLINTRYKYRV